MGCSHVYGIGLTNEETAPYLLEQKSGLPITNFGVSGGNIAIIKQNLEYLLEKFTPLAVVIAWPQLSRWLDPLGDRWGTWYLRLGKILPNDMYFKEYIRLLKTGEVEEINLKFIDEIHTMLAGVPLVEFYYGESALPYHSVLRVDTARDNSHPGPLTQIAAAEWINSQLTSKGIVSQN